MKRVLLITGVLLTSVLASAESYTINGAPNKTKIEAVKALINGQQVQRCNDVELSDKVTIKNKKAAKK